MHKMLKINLSKTEFVWPGKTSTEISYSRSHLLYKSAEMRLSRVHVHCPSPTINGLATGKPPGRRRLQQFPYLSGDLDTRYHQLLLYIR